MNTKPPECWSVDPHAHGLRVELSPSHSFFLPYEHFVYAELKSQDQSDVLTMVFATHEVVLRGQRFRRVEAAIQRRELASINTVPQKYQSLVADNQPVIAGLTVKVVSTEPVPGDDATEWSSDES